MKPKDFGNTVVRSLRAPEMFREHFSPLESWRAWITVLQALFGLTIESEESLALFREATGRTQSFSGPLSEAWLLCGRRSGKSRILALLAVCLACFRDYRPYLAAGEKALVMVLAADKDQASVIFEYAKALILQTPALAKQLQKDPTSDTIELKNRVVLSVHTSSYKSVRGRTLVAALCDEICFWQSDDSRNPAEAVIRALRPAMSTIPGSLLLCASSTYTKDGVAWEAFSKHWGKDTSSVLVWKSDTSTMNPSFRQEVIDEAYSSDAASAAAEYGSEWLSDRRQHFPDEDIDAAIFHDRQALTRDPRLEYTAFVDMSGGVSDASVLAIGHMDPARIVILDRLEIQKPPFRPEDLCQRFADILSGYGLNTVTGDRYSGGWIPDAFRRVGVTYQPSELNKSEIYVQVQPLFTQRRVELLDIRTLHGELRRLERRPQSGGKDKVDHPRGSHDDVANAACGALLAATKLIQQSASLVHARPQARPNSDYDPWRRFEEEQQRQYGKH